jgi:CRP-like cAMP-binding protein
MVSTSTAASATMAVPQRRRFTPNQMVLVNFVRQFMPMSDAAFADIFTVIKIRNYKKGAFLLREGQVPKKCFFVLQGCVRQYRILDGIEKTTGFFTEGEPVPTPSFNMEGKPANHYHICNEDCTLIEGSPEDEAAFLALIPDAESIIRNGLEFEIQKTQTALADFITSSPEERYLQLLETRPQLLDRVPQYQLASFLGIAPESLSRIRKRIMGKQV